MCIICYVWIILAYFHYNLNKSWKFCWFFSVYFYLSWKIFNIFFIFLFFFLSRIMVLMRRILYILFIFYILYIILHFVLFFFIIRSFHSKFPFKMKVTKFFSIAIRKNIMNIFSCGFINIDNLFLSRKLKRINNFVWKIRGR